MQLSIGDVESLHSQNRVLQGSSFSSIAAKFVNAESVRIKDEARNLQFGKPEKSGVSKPDNVQDAHSKGAVKVSWVSKSSTPKALSALEIFRKHFLGLQSRGDDKINPCSKETWSNVRAAWSELTQRERDLYEQLAHDSKVEALSRRKVRKDLKKKRAQQVKGNPSNVSNAVVPHQEGFSGLHLQILPVHELCSMFQPNSQDALERVVDKYQKKDFSFAKADYPIGESTLQKVWKSQVEAGIDGVSATKTFQRQAESVARPDNQHDVFPSRVLYEGFCGEQCRHHGNPARTALHCNTLALFHFFVQKYLGLLGGSLWLWGLRNKNSFYVILILLYYYISLLNF